MLLLSVMSMGAPTGGVAGTGSTAATELVVPKHVTALETALSLAHAALRSLHETPAIAFDLRPVGALLADAIAAIATGYDSDFDPLLAVRAASNALTSASAELHEAAAIDPPLAEVATWLTSALEWLRVAEERHARVPPNPIPHYDLLATVDALRLHHLPRAPLRPHCSIAAPKVAARAANPPAAKLPPAKSFEELDARVAKLRLGASERRAKNEERARGRAEKAAEDVSPAPAAPETRPGFGPGAFVALTREAAIADKARECAEEVGMLGMQRAPLLGDPWRGAEIFETRMFTSIDAFASLGSSGIGSLERTLADTPAKDATRVFAALLLGGCFVGRDALAMGERVARKIGLGDAEIRAAAAGALELAPHRDLLPMLRAWSTDADPGARAVAMQVLAYRGLAEPEEIVRAARDPNPWVKAVGIHAAGEYRVDDLDALVADGFEHEDPAVREATYVAGLIGDVGYVADRIEKDLDSPFEEKAMMALAIGGTSERHAESVVGRLKAGLTPPRIFAAGWCGSIDALPPLLDGLKSGKLDIALACAFALERITGAGLAEKIDLPPDALDAPGDYDDPDIGDAPPPPKLAQRVSDPRDLPADGSPDRVTAPTLRFDRWRSFLQREEKRFRPGARYRRGAPYTAAISFTELDRFPLSPPERRWLQRELVIRTGQFVRFDPHDLVPVQEAALREWGPHATRASSVGGSWSRPRRARAVK